MRTTDDLNAAFDALVRQGDEYLAAKERLSFETTTDDGDEIALTSVGGRNRRHRPVLWLTAAAVAACAAIATTVFFVDRGDGSSQAARQAIVPQLPVTSDQLVMPIVLPAGSPYVLAAFSVNSTADDFTFADGTKNMSLTIFPVDQTISDLNKVGFTTAGRTEVDLNGVAGYYLQERTVRSLLWQEPSTQGWVVLQTQTGAVEERQLVEFARGLQFSPGPAEPLRSALSLSNAPSGTQLVGLDVTYPIDAAIDPVSGIGAMRWEACANYEPVIGGGAEYQICTLGLDKGHPGMTATAESPGAVAVTIDGHHGYWYVAAQGRRTLSLDLGDQRYVNVEDLQDEATETYEQMAAVARTVTVVAKPQATNTWAEAVHALPLGE